HDQRGIEISTRYRQERTRPQDGELGKEQRRREQIGHENRGGVGRDEGADPPRLDARQRSSRDGEGGEQCQHDRKGEASLRQARRQIREAEVLFLWYGSRRVRHRSHSAAVGAHGTNLIRVAALHMIPPGSQLTHSATWSGRGQQAGATDWRARRSFRPWLNPITRYHVDLWSVLHR